jgi:DNA (cytosine-5)-methyltransferase 1
LNLLTFSTGAGGLSTGYDLSEYVDTRWAIESAPSAAATYQ